jgi:translation initiation factor 2 gamma subunit (eIF-2gamma)
VERLSNSRPFHKHLLLVDQVLVGKTALGLLMNTYVRHGLVSLDEAIPHIAQHLSTRDKLRVEIQGHRVGVTSLRLKTFARDHAKPGGLCCIACGLQATFFAIEADAFNVQALDKPHLNLYGVKDGVEVLFTHDHILARGLQGRDHISNTQTMCSPCNAEKAKGEQAEIDRIRALSKVTR